MRHYALVVDKAGVTGPRLTRCDDFDNPPPFTPIRVPAGTTIPITAMCTSLSSLAAAMTGIMGAPVVDRTELTGVWNYVLTFRDNSQELTGRMKELAEIENVPQLPVAIREQLGLRVEERRGPVDVIIVESAERPSEN